MTDADDAGAGREARGAKGRETRAPRAPAGLLRGVLLHPPGKVARAPAEPSAPTAEHAPAIVRLPGEVAELVAAWSAATGQPFAQIIAWALMRARDEGAAPTFAPTVRAKCADCGRTFLRPTVGSAKTKRFCDAICSARWHERESKRKKRAAR